MVHDDVATELAGNGLAAASGVMKVDLNELSAAAVDVANDSIAIIDATDNSSKKETLKADKVLVSVGRKPYTEGLNLTKIGIKKDKQGKIDVNQNFQTSIKN